MKVCNSFAEMIGNTPLLNAERFAKQYGAEATLLVKMESFNPAGSAKDRVAKEIIENAENAGRLKQGGVIIEPTSGNTGIGIAALAATKGYRAIMVMPDTMSIERINILKAYGAEVVLTEGALGMSGSIKKAEELQAQISGSIIAGQFENPSNPMAHYKTTGPEIWRDTEGNVDAFVATVGTGGTITGTAKFLKEQKPEIHVVAVEPETSAVLSGGVPGSHKIQGIGAGFVPKVLDTSVYDEVMTIDNEAPFEAAKCFAKTEGLLVGISSGAALCAAVKLSRREEMRGKRIVVLLPDGGDRYYSTPLFM